MLSMKWIIRILGLVWIFIILISISNALDGYTLLMNETFEDNDITGWTNGGSSYAIISSSCYDTYCVRRGNPDFNAYRIFINTTVFMNNSKDYFIEYLYYDDITDDAAGASNYAAMYIDYVDSTHNWGIYMTMTKTGANDRYMWGNYSNSITGQNSQGVTDSGIPYSLRWVKVQLNCSSDYCDGRVKEMDGTLIFNATFARTTQSPGLGTFGFIGYNSFRMDNIAIFELGESEPEEEPVLTINTDMQNNTYNYNDPSLFLGWNGTLTDETTELGNCEFWNDTNLLQTYTDINLTYNLNYTLDTTSVEDDYLFWVNCSNEEVYAETSKYYYRIDTVIPKITTSFVNHSILTKDSILQDTFTFQDPNLYWGNVTLTDINGNVVYTLDTGLINTSTLYSNTTSYSLSTTGNYTLKYEVWDSHTSKTVRPLQWFTLPETLAFDTTFITGIKESLSEIYLSEDNSKYKFKLTFEDTSLVHFINITSNDDIRFVYSDFKGHFVLWKTKRYIDFEGPNIKNVEVFKRSDNSYALTIELYIASDEIEIENSIGDLNYNSYAYEFTVINLDTLYLSQIATSLSNIEEGFNMIWIMLLYAIFMITGYWMIMTGNFLPGMINIFLSLGIDGYITYYITQNYTWASNFIALFIFIAGFVVIGKILMLFLLKGRRLKYA